MSYWWRLGYRNLILASSQKVVWGPAQFPVSSGSVDCRRLCMGIGLGAGRWTPRVLDPHTQAAAREEHGQTCPLGPSCSPALGVRKWFTMQHWTFLHGWPALTKGKKAHISMWAKEVKMISFIELSPIYVRGAGPHRVVCLPLGHTGLPA